MRTSEKVDQIAASLYAVHRDLENPRKDAKGQVRGRQDYRYLSLPALIDHAKKALKEAQVAVVQEVSGRTGEVWVTTRFLHLSGQFLEVGPIAMPAPNDPQQVGSVITYARRYALAAALNLAADEDTDGKVASSPALQAEPFPSGRDGAIEAVASGERAREGSSTAAATGEGDGPDGEGGAVPRTKSDPQRWMEEFHPGKPHHMVKSDTVPGMTYCDKNNCPYALMPEGSRT